MNMKKLSPLAAFIVLVASLLVGCQTTPSHKNISSEETDAFLKQFGAKDEATQKGWRDFVRMQTHTGEKNEGEVERWVQPLNKNNPCKIYQSDRVEKGSAPSWDEDRIYWDGDCRNGYANGIGREFVVTKGEMSSWLADYDGQQQAPTYHLVAYYDRQIIQFMGKSHPYYADLIYSVQQSPTGNGTMRMEQKLIDLSEDILYTKYVEIGGDTLRKGMVLPNKNKYLVDNDANPAKPYSRYHLANNRNETIGYSIISNNNGIYHVSHTNAVTDNVILPDSYRRHASDVDGKINRNLAIGEKLIQESYVAINKYKRRICTGEVRVDFIDNKIYGRICLENGELGPYAALIADAQTQQEKRHVQAREDIAIRQQQSRNEEIARGQARQAGVSALSSSLNDFANDMATLNRNQVQFTNSLMNSRQPSVVNFGKPEIRTNCILVSNIVSCRTR